MYDIQRAKNCVYDLIPKICDIDATYSTNLLTSLNIIINELDNLLETRSAEKAVDFKFRDTQIAKGMEVFYKLYNEK